MALLLDFCVMSSSGDIEQHLYTLRGIATLYQENQTGVTSPFYSLLGKHRTILLKIDICNSSIGCQKMSLTSQLAASLDILFISCE